MSISDPYKTGPAFNNSFRTESIGYTQGDAQDDPAIRLTLAAGVVSADAPYPLWGGMGIVEYVPTSEFSQLGSVIKQASGATCNGFSVFNQANHGVVTPSNQVPQYPAGAGIHFYRFGSGARIPLPISAGVAALAATGDVATDGTYFIWDATNHYIDLAPTPAEGESVAGFKIRLLNVSATGNLVALRNTTTTDVNWDMNKPIGLFLI